MMSERCLFDAEVPLVPQLDDNYLQIIQGSDHVVLLTDFSRRIVALGGRPPVGDNVRHWTGISTGRWEGETLVVETRNFNDRLPSFAGAGTARAKVVTERFTRTANNGIEYAATVVDPQTSRTGSSCRSRWPRPRPRRRSTKARVMKATTACGTRWRLRASTTR